MSPQTNVTLPAKFTAGNIINYLAEKNEISKKVVKQMLEDFFTAAETGAVSGQRVPFGNIGKLFIRIRPARGERKGRNPATGAEITIAAKPATCVPKFGFSKSFKEKSLKAQISGK